MSFLGSPAALGFGDGQAWADLTSSRVVGTTYQNTTGRTIGVFIHADSGGSSAKFEVSSDNTTFFQTGMAPAETTSNQNPGNTFMVPPDHYYRLNSGSSPVLRKWSELS